MSLASVASDSWRDGSLNVSGLSRHCKGISVTRLEKRLSVPRHEKMLADARHSCIRKVGLYLGGLASWASWELSLWCGLAVCCWCVCVRLCPEAPAGSVFFRLLPFRFFLE